MLMFAQYKWAKCVHTDYTSEKDRTYKDWHAGRHNGVKQKYRQTFNGRDQILHRQEYRQTNEENQSQLTHILLLIHIHVGRFVLTWEQPCPHCTWGSEDGKLDCISDAHAQKRIPRSWVATVMINFSSKSPSHTHTQRNMHALHFVSSLWYKHKNIQRMMDIKVREEAGADRP